MNISSIRPDNPTIAIEGQAIGEEPVNVSQDGWTAPKRSNYDRLKSMTIEEMAKSLAYELRCETYCDVPCCDDDCVTHTLNWLKQEAEE